MEGDLTNLTNKPKSTMFRFVALFALVAVALAEPEADAQVFVHPYNTVGVNGVPLVNTYTNVVNPVVPVVKPVVPVVKPVVPVVKYTMPIAKAPVVKYINPHHTEGMTKEGVPEKTASVKIAEKQHEIAQVVEDSKVKEVQGYVAPYTTYAGVHHISPVAGVVSPYVNYPYGHLIHKREADSESDAAYLYTNTYAGLTNTYPYNYYNNYAYNPVVSAATTFTGYQAPVVAHAPVYAAHHLGKREADSDAQYFYRHYTPYSYTNGYYPYTFNNAYNGYRNAYGLVY